MSLRKVNIKNHPFLYDRGAYSYNADDFFEAGLSSLNTEMTTSQQNEKYNKLEIALVLPDLTHQTIELNLEQEIVSTPAKNKINK